MLGKLLKYEFKATGKIFLLFYAGLIFIALLNMLIVPWGPTGNSLDYMANSSFLGDHLGVMKSIGQGLIFVMYIVMAIAVGILTLVAILMRFYKMLGDEGYLMFTLPVKTSTQIISKLIAATVWYLCSTVVIVISILIVVGRVDYFDEIASALREMTDMGLHPGSWFAIGTILVILSMIVGTLQFYFAIALGSHITRSRIGGTIIAYIIVYTVTQIISTLSTLPLMFRIEYFDKYFPSAMSASEIEWQIISTTSIYCLLLLLALGIPSYFLTHHLLKNKLNLT